MYVGWLVISKLESKQLWPGLRYYPAISLGDWGRPQSRYSICRPTFDAISSRMQSKVLLREPTCCAYISSWYTWYSACLRSVPIGLSTPLTPTHSHFCIQSFPFLCMTDSLHRRTVFDSPPPFFFFLSMSTVAPMWAICCPPLFGRLHNVSAEI